MNDLIVGCSTGYDWSVLKYWVNSINKSGFRGDKVLIVLNCDRETLQKVTDSGFKVLFLQKDQNGNATYPKSEIPVHVLRFLHIYNYLRSVDYRYVITTDVKDVVFQLDPIKWIEQNISDKNLILSSESILYKDEPWGNQNLLETYGEYIHSHFKNSEIFNVGVLAGKSSAIRDLSINIFTSALNRPIPICDQSTFNFMISMSPYKETSVYTKSESGWACQLGTTADPAKIANFRPLLLEPSPAILGDVVVTSTGIPYHIVHQYDRIPDWKKIIENKYKD